MKGKSRMKHTSMKKTRSLTFIIAALAMVFTFFAMTATSAFAADRYDMTPKYDANGNQIVGYVEKEKNTGYDAGVGRDYDNAVVKMAGGAALAAAPQLATAAAIGTVGAATVAAPAAAAAAIAAPLTAAEFVAPLILL